jgi:hypothetical protein
MTVLLALHTLATIMMAGLIWFVQLVHYPLFPLVGAREFTQYEREHTRRVTWIVAPLMSLEALTAIALVFRVDGAGMRGVAGAGLVLVAVIWASTAFLQVPCHRRLSAGFNLSTARRLVATNWLRSLAWSVRAGLALVLSAGAAA